MHTQLVNTDSVLPAYVKRDLFNIMYYVKSGMRIAEQVSNCVYNANAFIFILLNDRSFR